MSFPKAPKLPVTGTLKISIRNPEIKYETVEEDPIKSTEDLAEGKTFRLPPGFAMENNNKSLIERQYNVCTTRLNEIREKLGRCGACRRKVKIEDLDKAQELLEFVAGFMRSNLGSKCSMVVGQEVSGTITFDATVENRMVYFRLADQLISFGTYERTSLVGEGQVKLISSEITEVLNWLIYK